MFVGLMDWLVRHALVLGVGFVGGIFLLVALSRWIRYIPNTRVGLVEKLISGKGSVASGLIALNGEAGFQPDVLRGGWHLLTPFQYRIHRLPLVTIPQGKIGYVFARDGKDLAPTQVAGLQRRRRSDFQDVVAFLEAGGQKGPQRRILREGTYAINLAQFVVITGGPASTTCRSTAAKMRCSTRWPPSSRERNGFQPGDHQGADDLVGIVTVHDGPSLPSGEIIAPTVGDDAARDDDLPQQLPGRRQVPARPAA